MSATEMLNAFCVDLEEWFHVCGVETPYQDPRTWETAPAFVEKDTEVLLALLDDARVKGTFLTLGWLAQKYPRLIRRIVNQGHEIGCHGRYFSGTGRKKAERIDKVKRNLSKSD